MSFAHSIVIHSTTFLIISVGPSLLTISSGVCFCLICATSQYNKTGRFCGAGQIRSTAETRSQSMRSRQYWRGDNHSSLRFASRRTIKYFLKDFGPHHLSSRPQCELDRIRFMVAVGAEIMTRQGGAFSPFLRLGRPLGTFLSTKCYGCMQHDLDVRVFFHGAP
jgi:hypothetical protein